MVNYRLPRVTAVRYMHDHVLWLQFDDGLEGEVDLSDGLRGPIFEPLLAPAAFREVRLEFGGLAWSSGADWAPETLYERVRATKSADWQPNDDDDPLRPRDISGMPEISRFYGIVIAMLADDHAPPHFDASYGEYNVSVSIRDGVVTGRFPKRALRLLLEWSELHADELLANWDLQRAGIAPRSIEPLP
jgi:hypothetical protein